MDSILADMLACVGQHGPEILVAEMRIIRQDFSFAPACRQQLQQEVHSQPGAAHHGFAGEDGRICMDAFPPIDYSPLDHLGVSPIKAARASGQNKMTAGALVFGGRFVFDAAFPEPL